MRGGDVGIPDAMEQIQGSNISILLEAPADPGFNSFAGWDIALSTIPVWSLTLEGEVDGDLTGLNMNGLQVFGSGSITLGAVDATVAASVAGEYSIVIPPGIPAKVIGDAMVPGSWNALADGAASPTEGEGWIISVPQGSVVTITES